MNATLADKRPVALVTGASSGIGRELALLCAAGRHDLVLVARREQELALPAEEIVRTGGRATIVPLDLADPTSRGALVQRIEKDAIPIDVLINNAGFGVHGAFAKTDLATELELLEVN